MLKCSFCNKEFKANQIDEYVAHIQECAVEQKIKERAKDIKKISQELEELKRLQSCYEGMREDFKKKYPEVYKEHFNDNQCECENKYFDKEVAFREMIKAVADMLGAEVKISRLN